MISPTPPPPAASCHLLYHCRHRHLFLFGILLHLLIILPQSSSSSSFDPYRLDGGLISAVAGRNYIAIASDTRLTDGGYVLLSRSYSRLFVISGMEQLLFKNRKKMKKMMVSPDGTIQIPPLNNNNNNNNKNDENENNDHNEAIEYLIPNIHDITLLGCAGCASDCKALRIGIKSELDARRYWTSPSSSSSYSSYYKITSSNTQQQRESFGGTLSTSSISSVLMHILYEKRYFPFYSFCILTGFSNDHHHKKSHGEVYVYDAIGSNERVAVASTGIGREMMQPILDSFFGLKQTKSTKSSTGWIGNKEGGGILPRVVPTYVDCSIEETISYLIRAYQSVSEREIGIGDNVIICIIQMNENEKNVLESEDDGITTTTKEKQTISPIISKTKTGGCMKVFRFPLKQH